MRRIGRILVGEGIILEAGIFARRYEVGGVVDDAGVGGFIPQSADIPLALQTVEGDAAVAEGLGGGKSRRSRADNADLIGVALYIHALRIHLFGPPSFGSQGLGLVATVVSPSQERRDIIWRSWF